LRLLRLQQAFAPGHSAESRDRHRHFHGGPNALQYLLTQFPADFPATFVVVQHMPEGFTDMFARRLDECCALDVHEAKSGDLLIAGRVLICPGIAT